MTRDKAINKKNRFPLSTNPLSDTLIAVKYQMVDTNFNKDLPILSSPSRPVSKSFTSKMTRVNGGEGEAPSEQYSNKSFSTIGLVLYPFNFSIE